MNAHLESLDKINALEARVVELETELEKAGWKLKNKSSRIRCLQTANTQRKIMLRRRIKELEDGLEALLRARPEGMECSNFHHAPKDRHTGLECPCDARWDAAVESACNLLKR